MSSLQTAIQLLDAGRYDEAVRLCREALAGNAADVRVGTILAAAENARGNHAEAAALFRNLTRLQPRAAAHWANLATALRAAGEFDDAMAAYEEASRRGADSPDFMLNVALLHIDRLEFGRARALLSQAAVRAPRNAEIRYFQAVCSYAETRNDEARAALEEWRALEDVTPDRLAGVAAMLMQLDSVAEAEAALREALRRDPAHLLAGIRLAQLLERTNRIEAAAEQLARLPAVGATGREAADELLALRARLAERLDDLPAAKAYYLELLKAPHALHQRYHVLFPLGRVLDALGEHDRAMERLDEAHASQVAFLQKANSLDLTQPAFRITEFACDPADIAGWNHDGAPGAADSPIFVVGFPRSGTTLLEQTLDAHPSLRSMDEQPFLQHAIDHMRRLGAQYPEGLAALNAAQCAEVRARYWELAAGKAPLAPGQRLVDKNPLNMLRLPAIARLFPHARIILVIRHPCDVLISNYMQHYRAPEIAAMCRSLGTLAEGYRRAFDFWFRQAELLKPPVLELVYEDFVTDFETHARRLAAFLELPWHEAMLKPGAHALARGYISAPSYSQVVQPISRKAVGRWRRYERQFQPVLPTLEPFVCRWHYGV